MKDTGEMRDLEEKERIAESAGSSVPAGSEKKADTDAGEEVLVEESGDEAYGNQDEGRVERNAAETLQRGTRIETTVWRQILGIAGENRAAAYLEKRGFQVCCRNYRCRFGEIDIIAREPQRDILCFVEVKTRSSLRKGRPWEAVTPAKIRHLHRTAQHYLSRYRPACSGIRIDAAEILYIDHRFYIRYMENITG